VLRAGSGAAAAIVIIAVMLLAVANSFVTDDAFISFRYARNLVEKGELAWNPGTGERVEGYTNFLWTLLMAGAIAAGVDPVPASKIFGLAFALGTLLVTYGLAARVLRSRGAALLAVALLGTNYTFSAFATGGLETQMQTFLIATGALLAISIADADRWSVPRAAALSLLCAAALLTRLDSAIPVLVMYLFLFAASNRGEAGGAGRAGGRGAAWAALLFPALIVVGSWLLWKRSYYGSVLPNSYYVKGSMLSLDILKGGILYVFEFLRAYCLLPILLIFLFVLGKVLAKREFRPLAAICALWIIYIVRVGGDFMEFRFFVPVLPFIFILAVATLRSVGNAIPAGGERIVAALAIMLPICSAFHAATFDGTPGVEQIPKLRDYITGKNGNWEDAGKALAALFPDGDVTIATTAAGAIPYYSKLPAVDMLGMNDSWVARSGEIIGPRPGHRRAATLEYLESRGVNLVIGHPVIVSAGGEHGAASAAHGPAGSARHAAEYSVADLESAFMIRRVEAERIPAEAKILEIPIDGVSRLVVLYLTKSERFDAVIAGKKLAAFAIART
jgi:hypothetical protein